MNLAAEQPIDGIEADEVDVHSGQAVESVETPEED
jgi:hypothetical protein